MNFKHVLSTLAVGGVLVGSLAACTPALSEAEACATFNNVAWGDRDESLLPALVKNAPKSLKADLEIYAAGGDGTSEAMYRLGQACS